MNDTEKLRGDRMAVTVRRLMSRGFSLEVAEDAVQEALKELVQVHGPDVPGPAPLFVRAYWRALDEMQKGRRYVSEVVLEQVAAGLGRDTEDVALDVMEAERIRAAVMRLPSRERRDLLGGLYGYSDEELRDGRSTGAVASSRARARRRLRDLLSGILIWPLRRAVRHVGHAGHGGALVAGTVGCATVMTCFLLHPLHAQGDVPAVVMRIHGGDAADTRPAALSGSGVLSATRGQLRGSAATTAPAPVPARSPAPRPPSGSRVLASVGVSDGSGDSAGGNVDYRDNGRSLTDELMHCARNLSLDLHQAGCHD